MQLHLSALYLCEYLIHGVHDDGKRRKVKTPGAVHICKYASDEREAGELHTHFKKSAQGRDAYMNVSDPFEITRRSASYGLFHSKGFYCLNAAQVLGNVVGNRAVEAFGFRRKYFIPAEERLENNKKKNAGQKRKECHRERDVYSNHQIRDGLCDNKYHR